MELAKKLKHEEELVRKKVNMSYMLGESLKGKVNSKVKKMSKAKEKEDSREEKKNRSADRTRPLSREFINMHRQTLSEIKLMVD
jgi:hypothetical protein